MKCCKYGLKRADFFHLSLGSQNEVDEILEIIESKKKEGQEGFLCSSVETFFVLVYRGIFQYYLYAISKMD